MDRLNMVKSSNKFFIIFLFLVLSFLPFSIYSQDEGREDDGNETSTEVAVETSKYQDKDKDQDKNQNPNQDQNLDDNDPNYSDIEEEESLFEVDPPPMDKVGSKDENSERKAALKDKVKKVKEQVKKQNTANLIDKPENTTPEVSDPKKEPEIAQATKNDSETKTVKEKTPEEKAKDFIEEIKVLKPSETTSGSDLVPDGQELVSLHFPEPTDIKDIITAVSLWTGKNVILDDNSIGSAKIRMISPQKITKAEAYQAFLSALNLLNLTTVETGKVIKIIKTSQVNSSNIKTFVGSNWAPMTDEYITQIIPLKHVKVSDIQLMISKFTSSSYTTYEPTNTLIVSDSGYKIKRLLEIISYLDTPSNSPNLTVIPLKYADAKTVSSNIMSMGILSGSNKIMTDDKTNSLLVFANKNITQQVKNIIEKFDIKTEDTSSQANIHVRPLSYADATKLASTLAQLISGSPGKKPLSRSSSTYDAKSPLDTVVMLDDNVKITADETSNSLIISGSRAAYESINNLIKKLDVKRSQVFVEAEIIDMNLDGKFTYGSSIFLGSKGGSANLAYTWEAGLMSPLIEAYASNSKTTTSVSSAAQAFREDLVVGALLTKEVNIPGLGPISPGALIKMIKTDSHSNVLSSPHILTANNEQATITVGDTIYFKGSTVVSTTGAMSQNLEKENVDLELDITPKISPTNYITMKMNLTANNAKIDSTAQAPTIMKRKTSQNITVKNGQTVVISGLVKENDIEVNKKIPLLGDLPILGWLFRNSNITKEKTNLMIFLTPHIVHGANDLAAIYENKVKERDEFLKLIYGSSYQDQDLYKKLSTMEEGEYKVDAFSEIEEQNRKDREQNMLKDMGYNVQPQNTSSSANKEPLINTETTSENTVEPQALDKPSTPPNIEIEAIPNTEGVEVKVEEKLD